MLKINNAKWSELFGTKWDEILKICPEIGGFMLDHREKTVYIDGNSLLLLELKEAPSYSAMLEIIDRLSNESNSFARLMPQIFYSDGDIDAGILRWHYDFSGAQAKSVVPMCERPQFISHIASRKEGALVALLEFSMSDGSPLTDSHLFGALGAIGSVLPEGAIFCSDHKDSFWVYAPNFNGTEEEALAEAQSFVKSSGQGVGISEDTVERYITFAAGIGAPDSKPERRMATAEFALYQAKQIDPSTILSFSSEQYDENRAEYEKMTKFSKLVNENLFIYHFQPIVSAKDGEVIAYELLMRTDPSIGMYPLEILDCADKADRLYDIEKATISNALAIMEKNQDVFKNRKLFVNAITAHMLTDDDWNALVSRYGELMEKMVIEFTEQTEISDQEVEHFRSRLNRSNIKMAIDDYGTGYSNTSNLIKYSPDVVKIDRSLIEGINTKPTVRKLVSGIIEFIHENGFQALAEGVETYEELQTMIQLGSDLIQGYYVSKPKPIMLYEVSDSICRDIETINYLNTVSISRPYHPEEGESVDLVMIKGDGYNSVFVEVENVTLVGRTDIFLDTQIMVKNELHTKIVLENVKLKSEKDSPSVSIGDMAECEFELVGENHLDGKGIYVPKAAKFSLTGNGNLEIISNSESCFGIGVDANNSPGNIVVDIGGKLTIRANGDTSVGIGGGKNENSTAIRLIGGKVEVYCSGRSCIGVGIFDGNSIVDLENCEYSVEITAPDIVGIGSVSGNADISLKNSSVKGVLSGIRTAGIGSIEYGTGSIALYEAVVDFVIKSRTVNCVGTRSGGIGCHVRKSYITLYCEGGSVSGVGDMFGSGDVTIDESSLKFDFRSGDGFGYGSRTGRTTVEKTEEVIKINA